METFSCSLEFTSVAEPDPLSCVSHIISYSDREFNFETTSLNFLQTRFSRNKFKSKLFRLNKNFPPISKVQPIYGKAILADFTNLTNPRLLGTIKIGYDKLQFAKIVDDSLWVLGVSTLSRFELGCFQRSEQQRIEPKLTIKHRLLAGCHSFEISGNSIFVSSSGCEGVLEFNIDTGEFLNSFLLKGHKFVRSYRVFPTTDLIKNYVTNDFQKFHLNSVSIVQNRIYFSTLSGLIGYFDKKTGKSVIIASGYVGIHSLKFDKAEKHLHFISSTNGEFYCMDVDGLVLNKFQIDSKWVQGARAFKSCVCAVFCDTYSNKIVVSKWLSNGDSIEIPLDEFGSGGPLFVTESQIGPGRK